MNVWGFRRFDRFAAVLLFGLLAARSTCVGAEPPARPNVVFILADDLGWRDLGCYGSTFHRTPNLDRLASRGTRFTQAYAANPLCSPTRSSLLTGLWPARTGITAPVCHVPQVVLDKKLSKGGPNAKVLVAESVTRLKTDYVTLPKVLKGAGYRTGHFGKWHLGAEPYSALQQGFDVDWPHWPGPGPAGSYVAPWRFPPQSAGTGKPGEHIEDTLSKHVVDFIRENKDRPFYVNYWAFSVHAPYDAKDELVAKYRTRVDPKSPQRNPVYGAMVESLDDGVGRVMAALEECGIADRTIVVFFSDNGGISWGGTGGTVHRAARFPNDMSAPPTSNLPLRNGKASLYEGGLREPCLVVWPGVTRPGSVDDTIIQSIDWMPTILEMTGVAPPKGYRPDGIGFAKVLKGEAARLDREAIFTHFPHDTPASGQHPGTAVRKGDWKLIRLFAQNDDGSDQLELYDLKNDLGEARNLAAERPEIVRELNGLIDGFLKETEAVVPKRNPNYRPGQPNAPAAKPAAGAVDPFRGWKVRGADGEVKDGVLTVRPTTENPFLGFAAGGMRGKTTVRLRIRNEKGGPAKVECMPNPAAAAAKSVPYDVPAGAWSEIRVELPSEGPLGIVRVHLPANGSPTELDWIELECESARRRSDF